MDIPDLPFDPVTLNLSDAELPSVSILTPCYMRREFLPLIKSNIQCQSYPKEKLELVILQDGPEDLFESPESLNKFRAEIYPVRLNYKYESGIRRSIGEKRNKLVKMAKYKICAMMDSDDVYLSDYIRYSVNGLKEYNAGITSSACMTFVYPKLDFKMSAIRCGFKYQCHEACAVFTKKYFNSVGGFQKSSQGEGVKLFQGAESKILNLDIQRLMVCVCHDNNTIDKQQFLKINNDFAEFSDDSLKNLLKLIIK